MIPDPRQRPGTWPWAIPLALLFVALALLRPVDHDESQYVAATVLTAHGWLPYRDFAYLQTPLQPFLFAPLAWVGGRWTWPALRIANALLGAVAVGAVHRAARAAGADARAARIAALLFAGCDILLFSIGTARNDALPAALLALALAPIVRPASGTRTAAGIGLLLAAAAAAKISYALPALAYGLWTLAHRDRRPVAVLIGTLPVAALVGWTWALSPEGFAFDVLTFPARAPAAYYAADPWKLSLAGKAVDTLKFLALGAALPVFALVTRDATRRRCGGVLDLLILAGLVAALLPFPTWRQYLLPALPPLFVRFALVDRASIGRAWRGAIALFALAGIAPSIAALAARDRLSLGAALAAGHAAGRAMDAANATGPVATLAPELLPATGRLPAAAFATGPFYFRSTGLLDPAAAHRLHLVSRDHPSIAAPTVLVGGEDGGTGGAAALDAVLARAVKGWCRRRLTGTTLTVYLRPGQAACARRAAIRPS